MDVIKYVINIYIYYNKKVYSISCIFTLNLYVHLFKKI